MRRDIIEALPSEAADATIIICLDLKARRGEGQGRELRDWSRWQERDQHSLVFNVQASDAGGSSQKDVRFGGQF